MHFIVDIQYEVFGGCGWPKHTQHYQSPFWGDVGHIPGGEPRITSQLSHGLDFGTDDAKELLTKIGAETSLRYAIHLITAASLVATRRKAATVEIEDVSKAYQLFIDVRRSTQFLIEYQARLLPFIQTSVLCIVVEVQAARLGFSGLGLKVSQILGLGLKVSQTSTCTMLVKQAFSQACLGWVY